MAVFPVVFLLGLLCVAPVLLAVAIALGIWAWQNRAHWPDPKVFLIVGGVTLLLFLMLGFTSTAVVSEVQFGPPVPPPPTQVVVRQLGDGQDRVVAQALPHQVTVPAPVVVRNYSMSRMLMLVIGANLLFGFGAVMAWRMSHSPQATAVGGESYHWNSGRKSAAAIVGLAFAVALIGLIGINRYRTVSDYHAALQTEQLARLDQTRAQEQALQRLTQAETKTLERLEQSRTLDAGLTRISDTDVASALTPLNNDPLTQADRTQIAENPEKPEPEWMQGTLPTISDGRYEVIGSGQFASIEEARNDANRQCGQLLAADLHPFVSRVPFRQRRRDQTTGPVGPAIREEYVQQFERDFGSFFAPMYRVWYLVELSPRIREPVIAQVKAESQEGRVIAVAVAFAGLCLVPLGMILTGRMIRALGGRGRQLFPVFTSLVILCGWLFTAIMLNECIVIFPQ